MVLIFVAATLLGRTRRSPTLRSILMLAALIVLAVDHLLSAIMTSGFDSLSANTFATWASAGDGILGRSCSAPPCCCPTDPFSRGKG